MNDSSESSEPKIGLTCSCGVKLLVPRKAGARSITCPKCQALLKVPGSQGQRPLVVSVPVKVPTPPPPPPIAPVAAQTQPVTPLHQNSSVNVRAKGSKIILPIGIATGVLIGIVVMFFAMQLLNRDEKDGMQKGIAPAGVGPTAKSNDSIVIELPPLVTDEEKQEYLKKLMDELHANLRMVKRIQSRAGEMQLQLSSMRTEEKVVQFRLEMAVEKGASAAA